LNLLQTISNFITPISKVIDEVHTSEEEKAILRNELFAMQSSLQIRVLEYEKNLLSKQSQIITAEAQGNSWLQRSWRPITMLVFLLLVVLDSFGWLSNPLAPEAWTLLQIGLGGYVVGRSAEKLAIPVSKALKQD
tara:strand:- start:254 stop:658 length:405 start_codon:yes stop_codon:yes gene_type:complete